jgi:hypothetical protein
MQNKRENKKNFELKIVQDVFFVEQKQNKQMNKIV